MTKPLVPFGLFALMVGVTASAQVPVAPEPRPAVGTASVDGPTAPDGKGEPGKSAGPAETPRMTRLKQLSFDRRPSVILKAWAPQPKDDKSTSSQPKDAKTEALDKEVGEFQKHVTLGRWAEVKSYLAS